MLACHHAGGRLFLGLLDDLGLGVGPHLVGGLRLLVVGLHGLLRVGLRLS